MTKDEMMHLVNRSLFATVGYTDETGRQMSAGFSAYGTKDWAGILFRQIQVQPM